jgi:hypothetical protein
MKTNLNFLVTKIHAQTLGEQKKAEINYEKYPDTTEFWCMIDLVGSSNYRIVYGPKKGYIRGESFFNLIRQVINPNINIRLLKEMGDAVLLSSSSLRPLLECLILVDQVTGQIADLYKEDIYPFKIRGGISFGTAKRIIRSYEDYLGSCIDQLARIMSIKSDTSNLFLHEDAYKPNRNILEEYSDFLSFSSPEKISKEISKNMVTDIYYRELHIDKKAFLDFRDHFYDWTKE